GLGTTPRYSIPPKPSDLTLTSPSCSTPLNLLLGMGSANPPPNPMTTRAWAWSPNAAELSRTPTAVAARRMPLIENLQEVGKAGVGIISRVLAISLGSAPRDPVQGPRQG